MNHWLAKDYACSIDDVMVDFKDLITKDKKDALTITVITLKRRLVTQFDSMKMANVNTVLRCVKCTWCLTLWQEFDTERM